MVLTLVRRNQLFLTHPTPATIALQRSQQLQPLLDPTSITEKRFIASLPADHALGGVRAVVKIIDRFHHRV